MKNLNPITNIFIFCRIKTRNPNIPDKASLNIKTKAFDKNLISNTQSDVNSEQDSEEILAACIDAGVQSR